MQSAAKSLPAQPGIQQGALRRSVGTWSGAGLPDLPVKEGATMAIRITNDVTTLPGRNSLASDQAGSIWLCGSGVRVRFVLRREALLVRVEVRDLRLRPVAAGRCS